jgi:hypothetical protein
MANLFVDGHGHEGPAAADGECVAGARAGNGL